MNAFALGNSRLSESGIDRNRLAILRLLQGECWRLRMDAREMRDRGREYEARKLEVEAEQFERLEAV